MAIPCHSILGITVSDDAHANNIVSEAWQRFNTLLCGFLYRNLSKTNEAFITCFRPVL